MDVFLLVGLDMYKKSIASRGHVLIKIVVESSESAARTRSFEKKFYTEIVHKSVLKAPLIPTLLNKSSDRKSPAQDVSFQLPRYQWLVGRYTDTSYMDLMEEKRKTRMYKGSRIITLAGVLRPDVS